MHNALLIDELIQEIFEFCCDERDYRWTLAQLARCCRAWNVPALEKSWRKLPCISPLIRLAATATSSSSQLDTDGVFNYARNVRHIQFRARLEDFPVLDAFLSRAANQATSYFLPNLTSVEIAKDGCATLAISLSLVPALRSIDIDTGVHTPRRIGLERSNSIAECLLAASRTCRALETVRIRGFACLQLNNALATLTTLRVLSVKVGTSLLADSLAAIASFTVLEELTVHADCVNLDEFKTKALQPSSFFFPSLRTLRIRSQLALCETIIRNMQSIAFGDLDAEVIDSQDSSAWIQFFSAMRAHATIPETLKRLRIENHIELDDHDGHLIEYTHGPTQTNGEKASNRRFSLNTISPLSKIAHLQTFTLDTTFPPYLDDRGVDEITQWWPHLDALDLGCFYRDGEQDVDLLKWRPKTTLACLTSVASRCREMRRLVLPVDVSHGFPSGQASLLSQHRLRALVIMTPDKTITQSTNDYIYGLFPALEEFEFPRTVNF